MKLISNALHSIVKILQKINPMRLAKKYLDVCYLSQIHKKLIMQFKREKRNKIQEKLLKIN
jgi:hypothetical protein